MKLNLVLALLCVLAAIGVMFMGFVNDRRNLKRNGKLPAIGAAPLSGERTTNNDLTRTGELGETPAPQHASTNQKD
jgi:hypothetical protein